MGTVVQRVCGDEHLTDSAKRALVARVANSELFQKAPRLREFLLYSAECTLEGRLAEVREQVIAERVFQRKADFQAMQDSIVRAEARNLRKRLETYFATEGADEPVIITMPKGGYALAFEPRSPVEQAQLLPQAAACAVTELPPEPSERPVAAHRVAWWACTVCLVVAVTACGFALYCRGQQMQLERQIGIEQTMFPFSALFGGGRPSMIITSDTGFLQIAWLAHRSLTLNDYIARTYPDVPGVRPADLIQKWNLFEFTDGREMKVAGLILSSCPQFARRVSLRSGHQVTLEDFKTHTAVLIGSPVSNPWAQLFEDRLNFHCGWNALGWIVFRGDQPGAGGGREYPDADDAQHHRTYARIAFLPGTPDTPAALLIAGDTGQSTEAAGELVANRSRFARILRAAGIDPMGRPRYFEILLRSTVFVGGSTAPEVVAWRLNPAPER